ncbi:MAG TPA: ATP-binding protein [Candidatus Eisenbacteria bacterium]|nr:ATP-binding protein [Candidatus Eisenbacteria bacterium]
MRDLHDDHLERRVLVLAPTAKDAALAETILDRALIDVTCCAHLDALVAEVERGAGAILLPEEAVAQHERERLTRWLVTQSPWSDLPVLVMARPGADSSTVAQAMDLLGNVTVLERPIRVSSMVSAIRTALRSRQRQYETREHLQRIQSSERELRDFFDNAAVGLHLVDADGIIVRVNRTELGMLGYEREEFVGHSIREFHVDQALSDELMGRLAGGEHLHDFEARLRCKDGSIKEVLVDASALWEGGRFVHARCFMRDVSDRKRAEDALRDADRRKDEFLAILAHELRNPLAPIRNSLHILRLTRHADPTAERVTELMERQVNHMVRLVDDLLEVSRITRGKIELRTELVELAGVVRGAVDTSRGLIEAAGHALQLDLPPEPITVEGDPVRLTQVFANLLNNAAKYTNEGGVIRLVVRRDGPGVAISVRDNGTGIPAEMLPRVFDLFTQGDRSAGRAQGGLGIGLTLVKMLVEMHGGTVEAFSEGAGLGSEFVVHLPLVERESVRMGVNEPVAPTNMLPPRRILVVDDNQDSASSLGMLLKLLGADVHVVYSGPEALSAVSDYRPDVVLLDIGMPGMDGHEVARRMRLLPEGRDVTLIALTGWGQDRDRRNSELAGFDYHLIKPADVSALESLLTSLGTGSAEHRARFAPGGARSRFRSPA